MKFSQFQKAVLNHINALQEKIGDSFLELMVDTIQIFDMNGNEIKNAHGLEYNLSRSRHWDKKQNIYIFHDSFSDDHLMPLYEDITKLTPQAAKMTLHLEGMNDLDEPIHEQVNVEFENIND